MTKKIQNIKNRPSTDITDLSEERQSVAERYLDLWQDNIRLWATDPDAIEKWLNEAGQSIEPSQPAAEKNKKSS